MKKIAVIAFMAFLTACADSEENYTTQDSLERLDSMNTASGMMVDSANTMQRQSMDSMQNNAGMDSIR